MLCALLLNLPVIKLGVVDCAQVPFWIVGHSHASNQGSKSQKGITSSAIVEITDLSRIPLRDRRQNPIDTTQITNQTQMYLSGDIYI